MPQEIATYRELAQRWKALRSTHDVRVREVACVGAPRTLLCAETGDHSQPLIAIAAGMHGDEPAGPHALLQLVEARLLDARFAYRLWPCINPTGFDAGTRENCDGIDLNRTFGRGGSAPESKAIVMANRDLKFTLSLDLHEDCDAHEFYCYAYNADDVASRVASATGSGTLCPDPIAEAGELGGLSYSLLLLRNAARRVLTFETPTRLSLDRRVDLHCIAAQAAIAALER